MWQRSRDSSDGAPIDSHHLVDVRVLFASFELVAE